MPKVIFALLVLLLSSTIFAFSPTGLASPDPLEDSVDSSIAESPVEVYESTLLFSFTLQNKSLSAAHVLHSFQFSSTYKSTRGNRYIKHSRFIHPGLEVPDIIFPFHIFL